jgi:hypothetical protein
MVRRAVNDEVDVVQVFGGASRLSFITETIQNAIGDDIEIKRELPPTDTLAIGGAYALAQIQNMTVYDFPNLTRRSPYNVYVQCGRAIDDYCFKNGRCEEGGLFDLTWCEEIAFRTSPDAAPAGATALLAAYKLLNMSFFNQRNHTSGGFLLYKQPFPILEGVLWCKIKGMDCDQVAYEQISTNAGRSAKIRSFVQAVVRGQKEQQKAAAVKMRILQAIERISEFLASKECKADAETKEDAKEAVTAAEEAVKTLYNPVQLEVFAEALDARTVGLKLNL